MCIKRLCISSLINEISTYAKKKNMLSISCTVLGELNKIKLVNDYKMFAFI